MTGANMTHVPYRGGAPATADLISGQVQVMFECAAGGIQYIRAGSIRALAVTTLTRAMRCPIFRPSRRQFPAMTPAPGSASGFRPGTPREIIERP